MIDWRNFDKEMLMEQGRNKWRPRLLLANYILLILSLASIVITIVGKIQKGPSNLSWILLVLGIITFTVNLYPIFRLHIKYNASCLKNGIKTYFYNPNLVLIEIRYIIGILLFAWIIMSVFNVELLGI